MNDPYRLHRNDPFADSPISLHEGIHSASSLDPKQDEYGRHSNRTPSPTPSERRALEAGTLDWRTLLSWRFWIRKEWAWYYIVHWLTPVATWLRDKITLGWLVPIAVLFVISFPPLFGHEIVAVLCGVVWGLWAGFGIVAAGTFIGEVGNFYAFKYCCRARGEKLEKSKIFYGCLAKVVRDGGFKIALIARLSAIPGHFTTAVFSTCGMGILVFSLAAILSMPKQLITVYLGVILEQSATGTKDTKSRIISDVVLALTILITVVAMWYILREIERVKPEVIYQRRKSRMKSDVLLRTVTSASPSMDVFNPGSSQQALSRGQVPYQQWDDQGKAIGYAPDPKFIVMPKPRLHKAFHTDVEGGQYSNETPQVRMYPP